MARQVGQIEDVNLWFEDGTPFIWGHAPLIWRCAPLTNVHLFRRSDPHLDDDIASLSSHWPAIARSVVWLQEESNRNENQVSVYWLGKTSDSCDIVGVQVLEQVSRFTPRKFLPARWPKDPWHQWTRARQTYAPLRLRWCWWARHVACEFFHLFTMLKESAILRHNSVF